MGMPSLGDQELELLRFITERGPSTAVEAAEAFGAPRGLARTTIHTILERLRGKGYVTRKKSAEGFLYAARLPQHELLAGVVESFLRRTLGGSVKPFAAYLAHNAELSDEEIQELKSAVKALEARKTEGSDGGTEPV